MGTQCCNTQLGKRIETKKKMKLAEADIETEQKAAIFADGEKIKFNKSGLIYNPNAFAIGDNPYGDDAANQHQYFSMYSNRFEALKARIQTAIKSKFPDKDPKQLNELKLEEKVVVLGTLIKVHKNQPGILKTIAAGDADMNDGVTQEEHIGQRYDDDDEVFLEDHTQRMKLILPEGTKHAYLGGTCLAIHGHMNVAGLFQVDEIILPALAPSNASSTLSKLKRFVIIAGLEIGGTKQPMPLKLNLLAQYVTDLAGESGEINGKKLQSVMLADLISSETISTTDDLGRVISDKSDESYSMLDQFMASFASHIETVVLPSSTNSIPSRPLHPVLFQRAREFNLKSFTAPCQYRIDDKLCVYLPEVIFRNIKDYSEMSSESEIVEHLVRLSHWAPICPDIVATIPAQGRDIFVIDTVPDFVWTVGDKQGISTFDVDGHKVTVLVVTKFYLTSEFTIVTFDPESNDITTDVASLDVNLF